MREDEIRQRLEASTPEPWVLRTREWVDGGIRLKSRTIDGPYHDYNHADDEPEGKQANADVALILNAPSDLRYLLEENARLRRLVGAS